MTSEHVVRCSPTPQELRDGARGMQRVVNSRSNRLLLACGLLGVVMPLFFLFLINEFYWAGWWYMLRHQGAFGFSFLYAAVILGLVFAYPYWKGRVLARQIGPEGAVLTWDDTSLTVKNAGGMSRFAWSQTEAIHNYRSVILIVHARTGLKRPFIIVPKRAFATDEAYVAFLTAFRRVHPRQVVAPLFGSKGR